MKFLKVHFVFLLLFLFRGVMLFSGTFEIDKEGFYKDGRIYRILSGSLDYARIAQSDWNDRLLKARAMGLNTIATTVYWNFHETEEGIFDFTSGNKNLRLFLQLAKENNLNVILRIGPYAASDWDLGGLPAWLLAKPQMQLRSSNELFLHYVKNYFEALSFALKGTSYAEGGSVILIQIENEYGSYGNDRTYIAQLFELAAACKMEMPLFTIDTAHEKRLKTGTKDEAFASIVLSKNPKKDFRQLGKFAPHFDFMAGEFNITPDTYQDDRYFKNFSFCEEKKILRWLLKRNKSFNLHFFHAGSDLGSHLGASEDRGYFRSFTDGKSHKAPLTESGDITYEYLELRKILQEYQNLRDKELPPVPPNSKKISALPVRFRHFLPLSAFLQDIDNPTKSAMPLSMEVLGHNVPFIAYKTYLYGEREGELLIKEPKDIAYVYLNKRFLGKVDRNDRNYKIKIPAVQKTKEAELIIIVEQRGHLSTGANLMDFKGISSQITLNGINVMGWEIYPIPFSEEFLAGFQYGSNMIYKKPAIFAGTFKIKEKGDCFFNIDRWTNGMILVNGQILGRYYDFNAQKKLFCPSEYLHEGENTIFLFDSGMENLPTLYISKYR